LRTKALNHKKTAHLF